MTTSLNAQVTKGRIFLGAEASFTNISPQRDDDLSTFSFTILPDAGYFINDNVAFGLGIGYTQEESKTFELDVNIPLFVETRINAFVIAPFMRYYKSIGKSNHWYFWGQLRTAFNFGKNNTKVDILNTSNMLNTKTNTRTIDIAVSPGFTFFPSEKWAIEVGLRGLYYNIEDPDIDSDDNSIIEIGLGINSFTPNFGVRIFF